MSRLIDNLNFILDEKTTKLLPENLIEDVTILGVSGAIEDNGELNFTPTITAQEIPAGYTSGGTISAVDSSIDINIIPENIIKGITILGVEGDAKIKATDATATADDVLSGKTAYLVDGKTTGTMVNNGRVMFEPDTTDISIPRGFYASGSYIKGTGNINTYDATALRGDILYGKTAYVKGEKYTGSMPDNGGLYITPSTSAQSIPRGYTSGGTVGAVTSDIDRNIKAGNIKQGVTILGVEGSAVLNGVDTSDATAIDSKILLGETAYVDGVKITGTMLNMGGKTITPSTDTQGLTGGYYSSIFVNKVTSSIDANIIPENIKSGIKILGVTGNAVTLDTEKLTEVITPLASTYVERKNKYYNKLTVQRVTSNIDGNIQPNNIKKGVTILGTVGALEASVTYDAGTLTILAENYYNYSPLLKSNTMIVEDEYIEGLLDTDSKLIFTTDNTNRYAIIRCYIAVTQIQDVTISFKLSNNKVVFSELDANLSENMQTVVNVKEIFTSSEDLQTITYTDVPAGMHYIELKVIITAHSQPTELTFRPTGVEIRQKIVSQVYSSVEAMNLDLSQSVGTFGFIFNMLNADMKEVYRFNGEEWILSTGISSYEGTLTPEDYRKASAQAERIIG